MSMMRHWLISAAVAATFAVAACAGDAPKSAGADAPVDAPKAAAEPAKGEEFVPQVGQAGKDVIWVPTPDALVAAMLKKANVTKDDLVVDLGAGDGKIAIAAARDFGARARGIEYNPDMVTLAKRNAEKAGVSDRVTFEQADIFKTDFSNATVVTLYLLPTLNMKLRPTILSMKPGTRVVSNAFDMGDWKPDDRIEADGSSGYYWVVPANVSGKWAFQLPGAGAADVDLKQTFQVVEGAARVGGRAFTVVGSELRGPELRFALAEKDPKKAWTFNGRVDGDRFVGTVTSPTGQASPVDVKRVSAGPSIAQ
jgi:SAM-dependent methyltransferase